MIEKTLLAYDGSENSRRALRVAAELSSKLKAELCIVHVLMHGRPSKELVRMAEVEHLVAQAQKALPPTESTRPYDLLGAQSDEQSARVISIVGDLLLDYAKSTCTDIGATVDQTQVRTGDFADEIIEAAEDMGADLIVLGSRGLGAVRGAVLGSVSQKVLHYAEQMVLTVK